jgi:hypothetical protein
MTGVFTNNDILVVWSLLAPTTLAIYSRKDMLVHRQLQVELAGRQ